MWKSDFGLFPKGSIKSSKGYTLIEMIMAMAILALLTGALYSLFMSGGKFYQISYDSYRAENEARTAASYLSVKIRQNDALTSEAGIVLHRVNVEDITITQSALTIQKPDSTDYWLVYCADGRLREATASDRSPTTLASGIAANSGDIIADGLDGVFFEATSPSGSNTTSIAIRVEYSDGINTRELKQRITLRANP